MGNLKAYRPFSILDTKNANRRTDTSHIMSTIRPITTLNNHITLLRNNNTLVMPNSIKVEYTNL
jgi:SepF-like predicted cell division protein (DUF552 family)